MLFRSARATRGHMADLLRTSGCVQGPSALGKALGPLVGELSAHAEKLLGLEVRGQRDALTAGLVQAGAPEALAGQVGRLFALDGAIGLATLARDTRLPAVDLANAFIALGSMLGLDWAQARAATMSPPDPWERLLAAGLARDFQQMRFDFLRHMANGKARGIDDRVNRWAMDHAPAITRFRAIVSRAQAMPAATPAMLAQIAGQARNLLQA